MRLIRDYFMTTLGVIIVAIGICFFLIPANLATGGITGLAMVINHLVPALSIGIILLFLNVVLFVVGFVAIGPQFGAKTIYSSFMLTGVIYVFDTFFKLNGPLADDLLVNLIVGILIQGIGLGIVFNQNASTGGTDIIAKVLNKFLHIDIGKSLLMADFVVVILAGLTFGLNLGIYALLGIVLNGVVIDNVIEGFTVKVSVSIISKESDKIQKYIVENIERGATIYTAKGAYTMSSKEIITSVMDKKEFIKLKSFIKEIDKDAFVMISNVREVLGEGFYS